MKVYLTESLLATWIIMALLIVIAVIVRIKLKSFKAVPSGFQNVTEMAVEAMSNMAKNTLGPKLEFLGGYFFAVFAFILISNYSAMFGLRPPTSDIATTLPLGLTTFILIHATGIRLKKAHYFKEYVQPMFLFLPIHIISEISRPVSLALRLFGNILGGVVIMELIYHMLPFFLRFVIPSPLHGYFDVFVGAIQAFVFTVLSMTFISLQAEVEE